MIKACLTFYFDGKGEHAASLPSQTHIKMDDFYYSID